MARRKVRSTKDLAKLCIRPDPWPETVSITVDEEIDIVGESRYVDNIRAITAGSKQRQVIGCLILEPNNPHDPKAIAVHAESGIVGYIAKEMTGDFWNTVGALIISSGHCAIALNLYDGDYPYVRISDEFALDNDPKPPPPNAPLPPPPSA